MTDQQSPATPPDAPSAITRSGPPERALASPKREAPSRPPLASPNAPPVVAKVPPPASVRFAQLCWVLSFAVGGFCVVYYFIIREQQLPIIAGVVRGVTEGRSNETYDTASDIVFWSVFAVMVSVLIVQITLLVSFMSRRPGVRWWQLATFIVQAILLAISLELVATDGDGQVLRQLLPLQCGLVLLGLLVSTLPAAIAWSARRVDVKRGFSGPVGPEA